MLFNSFEFLFLFLPISVIGFFWLSRYGKTTGAAWLAFCSLFFYGWWDLRYVALLLLSIGLNFFSGKIIARKARSTSGRAMLTLSIAANLALLGYYKYAGFFVAVIGDLSGNSWPALSIVLPLGISFFTFTQIAFLVDAYRGLASEYRFSYYILFVTYFPHLIAGPILHHKEMMPQFDLGHNYKPHLGNFEVGLTIFIIGFAKKVLIADNLAPYANGVFGNPEAQSMLIAWGGVLAYTFQLYFDFSGYSDMAIGISRLFGIRLPLNFNSPYKAVNIIEFWRRWHMTLSRFLRDYLYISLGGNRFGQWRRHFNLFITMVLGGLWHGAGWNFVIWGGLHGIFLIINHVWRDATLRLGVSIGNRAGNILSILLTFHCVVLAWVFFRSTDIRSALTLISGMYGSYGIAIPEYIANRMGLSGSALESIGIHTFLGGGTNFIFTYVWIALAALVTFGTPNTQQLMQHFSPALPTSDHTADGHRGLGWQPRLRWALGMGVLATFSLISLGQPSEFLYFQF